MSEGDKEALWAQLQAIQRKEMDELAAEKAKIDNEKEIMRRATADPSDIVKINAGGEIIHCHRRTLCLAEGSMFSNLFSGRWDDSWARDEEGRIFLDHDPELIKLIVNFLRFQQIKDPSKPKISPRVPQEKAMEFSCLLEYFGLSSFFRSPGYRWNHGEIEVVQPGVQKVGTSFAGNGQSTSLTRDSSTGHHFVACKPALSKFEDSWWKITIDVLRSGGWVYFGIVGNLNADKDSYKDNTSYGWACSDQVYKAGAYSSGGCASFEQGESLHFCFIPGAMKLAMFRATRNQLFQFDDVNLAQAFIHFNFHDPGTKITLSPLELAEIDALAMKLGI